ncbi:MAG: hypothetical protein ABW021_09135 [Acidimicrobiia bacterium]|jgi:hypothetical protein
MRSAVSADFRSRTGEGTEGTMWKPSSPSTVLVIRPADLGSPMIAYETLDLHHERPYKLR